MAGDTMTTQAQQELTELLTALDDLVAGDATETEVQEVGDFWDAYNSAERKEDIGDDWAEIVEGAHADPIGSTFADGFIDQFLARRVCARCYGHLSKRPADNREWEAYCPTCEGKWAGATVSKSTADKRASDALAEYQEVTTNPDLSDLFPHTRKTPEQLLSELGF